MSLHDILFAQIDYEGDIRIFPEVSGSMYYQAEQYHDDEWIALVDGWFPSTEAVNAFLSAGNYRSINKQSRDVPFSPCWDYRIGLPDWPLFQSWLLTYSKHGIAYQQKQLYRYRNDRSMHEYSINAKARRDVSRALIKHIHTHPDLQWLIEWTWKRYKNTERQTDLPDDEEDAQAWYERTRTQAYRDQKAYRQQCHLAWKQVMGALGEYRDALSLNGGEA